MNTKLMKGGAALVFSLGAIAWSFQSKPAVVDTAKDAQLVAAGSKELVITSPEKPTDYGIGTYKVEGILSKGTQVRISLDNKDYHDIKANSEDGQYDLEVEVSEAGKHVLVAEYKDPKSKEFVRKKIEFKASDKKSGTPKTVEVATNNNEVLDNAPNNAGPGPEVAKNTESTNEASDPKDPNSAVNRKAGGVNDDKMKPKPDDKVKTPNAKKASEPKVLFAISSHTNFNVVPHGIIKIGGKGHPGDKVMLLVDNKPSMRGTIKPDGRWTFPVKVAKAGFRRITAQDLRSRESKSIKLKIK